MTYEQVQTLKPEPDAAALAMNHSREMQREANEQSGGAEETLPLDESEEQSPPEGTEDANP